MPLDNLHLTLSFLSSISANHIDAINLSLGSICRRHRPFELVLDRAKTVTSEVGHVFVATPRPSSEIDALHRDIDDALTNMGIVTPSFPWRPHITLVRPAKMPAQTWPLVVMPVQSVVLYKSNYQSGGVSQYESLHCRLLADP